MTIPTSNMERDLKNAVRPSLWPAFLGLWSFTWRSQLAWRRLPNLLATVLAVPGLVYITIDNGRAPAFYHWTVHFYLFVVLPLTCLAACGSMIRDELQNDTMSFLVTRPLTRARLFLLKYVSQMFWLQIIALANVLGFLIVGTLREVPDLLAFISLVTAIQVLAVLAYSALSSLFGLLNRHYLVLGIVYGFIVELGIGSIPTNLNSIAIRQHLQTFLAHNPTIRENYEFGTDGTGTSLLIVLAATLLALVAGAALFTLREYSAGDEMQK